MRAFDADALSAYRQLPLAVVLPETVEQIAAGDEVQGRGHQGGAARGRDIIVRWGIAACRRRPAWAWQIQTVSLRLITTIAVSLLNLVLPTLPLHMRCRAMVFITRPTPQARSLALLAAMSQKIQAGCIALNMG